MTDQEELIRELATVAAGILQAGANKSRCWVLNADRQQDADVLDAMAAEALEIARHGVHPQRTVRSNDGKIRTWTTRPEPPTDAPPRAFGPRWDGPD